MKDRAQLGMAEAALGVFIGLLLVGLLTAIILPSALNALTQDATTEINQTVAGGPDEVNAQLDTNYTAATSATSATVELSTNSTTTSKTINVGSNATYSFSEGDVDVGVTEAGSSYAVANYSYPNDFGFSAGASSIWNIIDLIIIIAPLLFIVGIALAVRNRM